MIRSWIIFVFLFVCGLVALRSPAAQQKDVSRAGWISDAGLWGQTYEGWRCGLRAEMLAWRRFGGTPGMETPTSRLCCRC